MKVTHIVFDVNTFGITQRSLNVLRDTIAENIHNRIAVVEVPTNNLCCGYFVFDLERQKATFTGDGFRRDKAGEGGAGYRSAKALFSIFRINPIPWEPVNLEEIYALPEKEIRKLLLKVARKIADNLCNEDFCRPADKKPYYIQT